MEFKVLLNMVEDVKKFVDLASKYEADIIVRTCNKKYEVDASSIMGMFSLDLSSPVIVHIEDIKTNEKFKNDVAKYIVE